MPRVSIVIPTCDRPELLARALDSVRAQTFEDYEVIVVDDGREAHAERIVQALGDKRVRAIRHETPRRGGSASRNTGIREARADLIAFLDDDDEWMPEKLALQVAALDAAAPLVGFSVTGACVQSEEGEHRNEVEEGEYDFSRIALIRLNGFLTTSLVIRRDVFENVGSFDESFPSHQEAELMIRITRQYRGYGINKPLVRMNMFAHEHIGGDLSRRIQGRLLLLEKHGALFKEHPQLLARHYFTLGIWYRNSGNLLEARAAFRMAWVQSRNVRYLGHYVIQSLRGFSTKK